MSKKIQNIILGVILSISAMVLPINEVVVNADSGIMYNGENTEHESIGYLQIMPRGMYLQSGYSRISDAGNRKITAGGATMAQMEVEDLTICVEVQKMNGGKWATYKMWTVEKKNESAILTSKTFEVEPGIYRVICIHSANSDASSSFTNALSIS